MFLYKCTMTRHETNKEYFNWICHYVLDKRYTRDLFYTKLLAYLHEKEFIFKLDMDGNRASDGIDLRYRFGYDMNYPGAMIATYLDNKPCSILEMMVALAIRCEENIMSDLDKGDRTGEWFWEMVSSMGLDSMDDMNFDEHYIDSIISRFINRDYEPDGRGGLFTIPGCRKDLRNVEIWYQMCWYLNTIID